jgi:hypothetical protein
MSCHGTAATRRISVHKLEELHRKFDIPQPAAAQLDLALLFCGGDVFSYATAHGLHRLDKSVPAGGRPYERRNGFFVPAAQVGVAGNCPGLQERLEFPALRPAGVIAPV